MTTKLFFDTYALIELLEDNNHFRKYADCNMVITKLNLFEFYFYVLRTANAREAQRWLIKCSPFAIGFDNAIIAHAANFKLQHKQCSMTDCIGYAAAQRLGIPFLTGDKAFEKIRGVEFVK